MEQNTKKKIPCGGFMLGEGLVLSEDGKTLNVSGGGGSVPKPLTYDYMPEGYPKKVEFTGTLMEEQSVPNGSVPNGRLNPNLMVPFVPIEGKTYTVNFEGIDYNCICHKYELVEEGATEPEAIQFYIGNPSILDIPGETSEPFLYVYQIMPSLDNYTQGFWCFNDEAESHTVSVQGTGIKTIPISPSFLPNAKENAPTSLYLRSSGEHKLFEITVNDSGTLSATEAT